ncbi:MAG: tetratricopeptide repeat protein [Candidatus Eremiobacteraeota bacterium]|nr:tetratricopeptide repeat protein [Candidatus Eremiobacteraeota bacterium]
MPDYQYRNATISFYEKRVRRDKEDQISARLLAGQYMQRYREQGDIDDIRRALVQARRALQLQPQNSSTTDDVLASANTALHRFKTALKYEQAAMNNPEDWNGAAQAASLEMELGRYEDARRTLDRIHKFDPKPTIDAVQARYDELTGQLTEARSLIDRGGIAMDSVIDNSAQGRAWFHYRAGELAFSSGDLAAAEQDERDALATFPSFSLAYNALARFCWASRDWNCALDAATKGANIVPLPETLGYKADAQRALGDAAGAAQTDSLIFAIERIGNAYHVSDRLLAIYYSEHGVRLDDALTIARREVTVRGNEIYAQDTLAWAAAMDNHWDEARTAIAKAIRYDTEDPRIQFHAGMIALHFGDKEGARKHLQRAIDLNPQFHPVYADEARSALAKV